VKILHDPAELSAWTKDLQRQGRTIGFVPTMGFLHEGHCSLMRIARPQVDILIVSIFVNPTQFAPGEDLDRYPRDEEGDLAKCRAEGVDAVFLPTPASMYPDGYQTVVTVPDLASGLCGRSRPTHFAGVATVVLKLFHLVRPDVAVFGRKDYQQLAVIRRLVRDLDLDVDVQGGPIVRESDGLAMSSRNAYLQPEQRQQALALSRSLDAAEAAVARGTPAAEILATTRATLGSLTLGDVDYVELVDADEVTPVDAIERPAVLALAVRFGGTRLIDNRVLVPHGA
jgi:pantoate--beta-alanine ligase